MFKNIVSMNTQYLSKLLLIMGSLLIINTVNASDFKDNDSVPALPVSHYNSICNTRNKFSSNINNNKVNNSIDRVTCKTNNGGGKSNDNMTKSNTIDKQKLNNFIKNRSLSNHVTIKKIEVESIYEQLQNFRVRNIDPRLDNSLYFELDEKRHDIKKLLNSISEETNKFSYQRYNIKDFINFQQNSIKKLNELIKSNNYLYFIQDIVDIRSLCEELITLSRAILYLRHSDKKYDLRRHETISQYLPKLFG